MPIVDVNGVRINYIQFPCESAIPAEDIVMVHGLATNLGFWYLSQATEFSKLYRITLYDLRGHGRSSIPESGYSVGNLAVDLRELLDCLGILRAHFVAHSMGGAVALNLACMDPARFASLVLLDTHISAARCIPNEKWKFGEKIQRILSENGVDIDVHEPYFGYKLLSAAAYLKLEGKRISRELEELIGPVLGNSSKHTAGRWLKLVQTTQAEKELMGNDGLSLEKLRQLRFPILAMYGERSQAMSTGERLLELWPHADFRRIRDCGHFFPITRPSEFMENCRHFWNGARAHEVPHRDGDFNRRYFRSERFYSRKGQWFFDTRESRENGPFHDLGEAKEHLWSHVISDTAREDHSN